MYKQTKGALRGLISDTSNVFIVNGKLVTYVHYQTILFPGWFGHLL